MLDFIAHFMLLVVLVLRHGDLKRAAPYMCLGSWVNTRMWGMLTTGHPFPGLNLGLSMDAHASEQANSIYEYEPKQKSEVWGTAYVGESLALSAIAALKLSVR